MRHEVADDRIAHERHIPNHVQDLVADELVFVPEGVVQHAGVADDDRVFERAAERQPLLPHHLDFLEEAERARRRDLLDERLLGDANRPRLVAQQRMVERDAVGDLEVIRRIHRNPLVAV